MCANSHAPDTKPANGNSAGLFDPGGLLVMRVVVHSVGGYFGFAAPSRPFDPTFVGCGSKQRPRPPDAYVSFNQQRTLAVKRKARWSNSCGYPDHHNADHSQHPHADPRWRVQQLNPSVQAVPPADGNQTANDRHSRERQVLGALSQGQFAAQTKRPRFTPWRQTKSPGSFCPIGSTGARTDRTRLGCGHLGVRPLRDASLVHISPITKGPAIRAGPKGRTPRVKPQPLPPRLCQYGGG